MFASNCSRRRSPGCFVEHTTHVYTHTCSAQIPSAAITCDGTAGSFRCARRRRCRRRLPLCSCRGCIFVCAVVVVFDVFAAHIGTEAGCLAADNISTAIHLKSLREQHSNSSRRHYVPLPTPLYRPLSLAHMQTHTNITYTHIHIVERVGCWLRLICIRETRELAYD